MTPCAGDEARGGRWSTCAWTQAVWSQKPRGRQGAGGGLTLGFRGEVESLVRT